MAKSRAPAPVSKRPEPEVGPHEHPLPPHQHDHEHEHAHPLPPVHDHPHEHDLVAAHAHPPHEHHEAPKHEHREFVAQLRGSVRALISVVQAGTTNSEQLKAIHQVRVVIGDAHGSSCAHENSVYEQGDRLICQDCRAEVTPDASG